MSLVQQKKLSLETTSPLVNVLIQEAECSLAMQVVESNTIDVIKAGKVAKADRRWSRAGGKENTRALEKQFEGQEYSTGSKRS